MLPTTTRRAYRMRNVSPNVHTDYGWTKWSAAPRGVLARGALLGACLLGCSGSSAPSAGASPAPSQPATGDDGSGLASDDSGAGAALPVGDGDDAGAFGA